MSIVLIGARHVGEQLRRARRGLHINTNYAAKILKISVRDLHKYESGKQPVPPDLMCALFHRGLALTAVRTYK